MTGRPPRSHRAARLGAVERPNETLAPDGYVELLEQLKTRVRAAQLRAVRSANLEVLTLYWSIGRDIVDRQDLAGWGARIVDRLAADLRAAFPDQRGWSRRNLQYMRALATAWPDRDQFVQQAAAQMPWGHVMTLLDRLDTHDDRTWYAAQAVEHGWSRTVLEHQIMNQLRQRIGAAPSNFAEHLPPADSELAQQLLRDPYVFDHLTLTRPVAERDLEQALMDRLQATLLEFGHGMAFVGRQVRFDVDGDELVVDLLLFHVEQLRYVVVELKIGRLQLGDTGQLGVYVALVDDRLRRPDRHAPTIGLLLVAGRNEQIVRYALSASSAPLAVADYTYDTLPPDARAALPTAAQLAAALDPSTLPRADPTDADS
jgi:predicted nuclease of restriction endonuclease-like (RecB) superfamily